MKEDFITFEIAKKLKEKGFNWKVNAYYGKHDNLFVIHPAMDMNDSYYGHSAPTIDQVLKWLRNEKKIFINVDVRTNLEWYYEVWNINKKLSVLGNVDFNKSESYEESALAGIEYVIDNLI